MQEDSPSTEPHCCFLWFCATAGRSVMVPHIWGMFFHDDRTEYNPSPLLQPNLIAFPRHESVSSALIGPRSIGAMPRAVLTPTAWQNSCLLEEKPIEFNGITPKKVSLKVDRHREFTKWELDNIQLSPSCKCQTLRLNQIFSSFIFWSTITVLVEGKYDPPNILIYENSALKIL